MNCVCVCSTCFHYKTYEHIVYTIYILIWMYIYFINDELNKLHGKVCKVYQSCYMYSTVHGADVWYTLPYRCRTQCSRAFCINYFTFVTINQLVQYLPLTMLRAHFAAAARASTEAACIKIAFSHYINKFDRVFETKTILYDATDSDHLRI